MTPVSVLIPIRVQCVLLVLCVLAAIVGVGLGIAVLLDWIVGLAF